MVGEVLGCCLGAEGHGDVASRGGESVVGGWFVGLAEEFDSKPLVAGV